MKRLNRLIKVLSITMITIFFLQHTALANLPPTINDPVYYPNVQVYKTASNSKQLTRAEFAQELDDFIKNNYFLLQEFNFRYIPKYITYNDINDQNPYYSAIYSVTEKGLVNSNSASFYPDTYITQKEAGAAISKLLHLVNMDFYDSDYLQMPNSSLSKEMATSLFYTLVSRIEATQRPAAPKAMPSIQYSPSEDSNNYTRGSSSTPNYNNYYDNYYDHYVPEDIRMLSLRTTVTSRSAFEIEFEVNDAANYYDCYVTFAYTTDRNANITYDNIRYSNNSNVTTETYRLSSLYHRNSSYSDHIYRAYIQKQLYSQTYYVYAILSYGNFNSNMRTDSFTIYETNN